MSTLRARKQVTLNERREHDVHIVIFASLKCLGSGHTQKDGAPPPSTKNVNPVR